MLLIYYKKNNMEYYTFANDKLLGDPLEVFSIA